ncbi:hypothetical protein [Limosilactobacillus mucosae]|uniref:Uncharacterized protein n=1 Tax=Limosilactobacillus mucosae TaxID=97478 RepID=A0AAJ1M893_LIMMU|nr:hypothetical protein [Limosilactobacillus mucosae]MDC2828972.1 hypothetical protein [Limosilactobacillus mucosae]
MNIKEDLKELVNFEKNTEDIHMVKGDQHVDDVYDGMPWMAIFILFYAIFTKRYKAEHMIGTVFKYCVYFIVFGLLIDILFGAYSEVGNTLNYALDGYEIVWFVCAWRRIYVQVLERNGFHKVDVIEKTKNNVKELSNDDEQ